VNELSAPLVDRQTWSYSIRAHGHANCADRTVDPQIVFNGGGGTPQWGPSQKLVAALAILFALTTLWLLWKPPGRRTGHA
jgi:hypothetical protein